MSVPHYQCSLRNSKILIFTALTGALALSGCRSIGARSVTTDRFDYNSAISESWKQQVLLNIVKLRYLDLPVFVDVSSVVAGYSLQTGVTAGGTLSSENAVQGNFPYGQCTGHLYRPAHNHLPTDDRQKFLQSLLTPIDPKNIFFMLQSGYAADFLLGLSVQSLNGLRNRSASAGVAREADPDFIRVLQLIREVQAAGGGRDAGGSGQEQKHNRRPVFPAGRSAAGNHDKITEIRRLLQMPQGLQKFDLIYSPVLGDTNELAVGSRSMFQIMTAFASYTDVPESDLKNNARCQLCHPPTA